MKTFCLFTVFFLLVAIAQGCGGKKSEQRKPISILVEPQDAHKWFADFPVQYYATGIFDDNTTRDLTNDVVWTSSNTSVAIDAKGSISMQLFDLLYGLRGGCPITTTITAAYGVPLNIVTGQTTLTVYSYCGDNYN